MLEAKVAATALRTLPECRYCRVSSRGLCYISQATTHRMEPMTTYHLMQEQDDVFDDAWAIVATGLDGTQRWVARYLTFTQARTMVDRLSAVVEAGSPPPAKASSAR